jgi:hypothetical protein
MITEHRKLNRSPCQDGAGTRVERARRVETVRVRVSFPGVPPRLSDNLDCGRIRPRYEGSEVYFPDVKFIQSIVAIDVDSY